MCVKNFWFGGFDLIERETKCMWLLGWRRLHHQQNIGWSKCATCKVRNCSTTKHCQNKINNMQVLTSIKLYCSALGLRIMWVYDTAFDFQFMHARYSLRPLNNMQHLITCTEHIACVNCQLKRVKCVKH